MADDYQTGRGINYAGHQNKAADGSAKDPRGEQCSERRRLDSEKRVCGTAERKTQEIKIYFEIKRNENIMLLF